MQRPILPQRMAWSLPELAALLGLSVGFLRKEARRGALRTRKIGRRVLVLESDRVAFLERPSEKPPSLHSASALRRKPRQLNREEA